MASTLAEYILEKRANIFGFKRRQRTRDEYQEDLKNHKAQWKGAKGWTPSFEEGDFYHGPYFHNGVKIAIKAALKKLKKKGVKIPPAVDTVAKNI